MAKTENEGKINTMIRLSTEEILDLAPILSVQSERAKHPITLQYLLDGWTSFVSQVEIGYENSIYEYTNDLSIRDLIQELVDNCSPDIRNKLLNVINLWDDRFKQATRSIKTSLLPSVSGEGKWWWFRIPIKPGDELRDDLQVEELW